MLTTGGEMSQKESEVNTKVSLDIYKRTKIIATIGPSTDSYEAILGLISAGANGLRLNFSHGSLDERVKQIGWIRKASKELGKPVAIIQDLQGPKIRLGDFDGAIEVKKGQSIALVYGTNQLLDGQIPVQYDLSKKVKRGEKLFLFDGKVRTTITSVNKSIVIAKAENDGILIKRKGINLPDTDFGGDVITPKDRADLVFGSTHDIDYVAQSFVQSADDVRELRLLLSNLGMQAKIIVKFETKKAIDNMNEIVEETDLLMVARGDLAYEVLPEAVPTIQRQLIGLCRQHAKPVIVATQMLFSMTTSTEPTRAEVSDIATAVVDGADCLMLSDETANGNHPIEAVKFMKRVILFTENNSPQKVVYPETNDLSRQSAISDAIVGLAGSIQAKAIVAETKSGATAIQIAAKRSTIPIIAVTSDQRIAQQLAIVYVIKTYVRPANKYAATKLTDWLRQSRVLNKGDIVVTASGKYPGVVGTTDTVKVRMLE
jgi:pyruvate kinase